MMLIQSFSLASGFNLLATARRRANQAAGGKGIALSPSDR